MAAAQCSGYPCVLDANLGEVDHLDERSRTCRGQGWLLTVMASHGDRDAAAGAWFSLEAALIQLTYRHQLEFLLRAAALLAWERHAAQLQHWNHPDVDADVRQYKVAAAQNRHAARHTTNLLRGGLPRVLTAP